MRDGEAASKDIPSLSTPPRRAVLGAPGLWLRSADLLTRARRRLAGEARLEDAASRTWIAAPAARFATPPSLFLDGEPDKIRTLDPCTSRETETRRMQGAVRETPEVRAFQFSDCGLYRGSLLARGRARRIRPHETADPPGGEAVEIAEGALAGSYLGLRYFGHWLRDDATLTLLGAAAGEPVSPAPPADWRHVDGYARLLALDWRRVESARFKRLTMFSDEAYSPSKGERLAALRAGLRAAGGLRQGARRVFLRRAAQDAAERALANEDDVAKALAADGFAVIEPLSLGTDQIAEALFDAELVVGAEGSNLAHAVYFLKEGGGVLAITSQDRFNTSHKRWTDLLGMRYGFLVTEAGENGQVADIGALRRTIELFG